jgi:hypothetical protein
MQKKSQRGNLFLGPVFSENRTGSARFFLFSGKSAAEKTKLGQKKDGMAEDAFANFFELLMFFNKCLLGPGNC